MTTPAAHAGQIAQPMLSVVVPMKNEAASLEAFFATVVPVLRAECGERFEIVCVNDGSTDDTLAGLLRRRAALPQMRVIDLSRNFGKEAALTAGLQHARGEAVIPMDVDLQDPPELIPEMVAKWREGFEVVSPRRVLRDEDTPMKRLTAGGFYAIMHRLSEIPIPANVGDFRLMEACVVRALLSLPERTRFNKGIFAWVGFRQCFIDFERPARRAGGSAWTARSLWRLAIDGITCFSSLPLRVWSLVGVFMGEVAMMKEIYDNGPAGIDNKVNEPACACACACARTCLRIGTYDVCTCATLCSGRISPARTRRTRPFATASKPTATVRPPQMRRSAVRMAAVSSPTRI